MKGVKVLSKFLGSSCYKLPILKNGNRKGLHMNTLILDELK